MNYMTNNVRQYITVNFDKSVAIYMDNYHFRLTPKGNVVLYSYDGTLLKYIWDLRGTPEPDIALSLIL